MLELFKALADPCRLRLVALLLKSELTVQELTQIMGMGQSRISRHLKILAEAGVLSVKRQGTWSYYRAGEQNPFFSAIRPEFERALEQLPERRNDLAAVAQALEARRKRSLEFFDRHAAQWDELSRTLLPVPEYQEGLLALVPEVPVLLEIGVGTGTLMAELARKAKQVIGVDHSPAMLVEARRRLVQDGVPGAELRLGEMTHLPIANGGVGCVIANMVLHHAPDPQAVLAEMARVLQPQGIVVLADLARHEREWAREQLADQWLGFEEEELKAWLAGAGLSEIAVQRVAAANGAEDVLLVRAVKK
ncbi:metalloregulator ArsR/SmtB family transcription factor [Geomonas nitrogeniifigens]|uniref:Metalloregulator ArsR/SmtB family transcription factor n=1 Tax=Geomonas diazotrophica TaxID=2843197 RepID=A0ABX8JCS5_9BACT|nr:metalloregulator ArsR/SmtB family transcription factor [Geomonas nitrogeniifigens]QWV96218.1 metalloregulator ArsR/SmtB family transcription factor [Geomonas nitrogeniifigens]QXE85285.1 metalloregulator ArsR/SmtB family transcription factor [Geomonas nitrogeniifigens]